MMTFLRSIALCLLVLLSVISSLSAHAANSVPPDVGQFDYGFNRCETVRYGYASRQEDEQVGGDAYYGNTCHGAMVVRAGPWATATLAQPGACGGDNYYASYFLNIESASHTADSISYTFGKGCTSTSTDGLSLYRRRSVSCPTGYVPNHTTNLCDPPAGINPTKNNNTCNAGCNGTDPINSATGALVVNESDYAETNGNLNLDRTYTSMLGLFDATSLGSQWRTNYDRRITVVNSGSTTTATAYRPNGDRYHFSLINGQWVSDADVALVLTMSNPAPDVYTDIVLTDTDGTKETYDSNGLLTEIIPLDQRILTVEHSGIYVSKVTDRNGRSLTFKYGRIAYQNQTHLTEVDTPDGLAITFAYDSSHGNLTSVNYTGTVDSQAVTQTRSYVYGETGAPYYAMTGLIDEAGQRFASWSYDAQHRAILSVHGMPTDFPGRTELTYNADGTTSIKNWMNGTLGLSSTRSFAFDVVEGVAHLSGASCESCDSAAIQLPGIPTQPASVSYDASGYPASSEDFDHNVTVTKYDDNYGLLTQQIDASGTPSQRTTNTTWDATLRVPLSRAVLDASGVSVATTSWLYNGIGQPLARCEIDPAKAVSYTCAASGTVPAGVRRWTYTYCDTVDATHCPVIGLTRSMTGPRADLVQATTYSYYMDSVASGCSSVGGDCHQAGDLYQVTDALGHSSTVASYDGAGRPTRLVDANGVTTDLTYTPRGWLKTRTVGGATTTMNYTPYGAVASLTDPDNVSTTFTYDAAHRLVGITDAQNNTIHYTLDAAGNTIGEQTRNASGGVMRSFSRTYNELGQLTATIDGLDHTIFNAGYSDSYDPNGNLVHSADGLGAQRHQGFDALNRLNSVISDYNGTDPSSKDTQTAFHEDALDRLDGISDPDGLNTIYTYDGLSNRTEISSPDTGTSVNTYDATGNSLSHTDAKGVVSSSTYDALDRILGASYVDSTLNAGYHYDEADSVTGCTNSSPIGRLTRVVEYAVSTTYCYDARGNITQKSQTQGTTTDTTHYTYTLANRLSSQTNASGNLVQYIRDSDGRISGITVQTPVGTSSAVSAITYLPFGPINSYTLGNGQTVTRDHDANYAVTDVVSSALNLHFGRDAMGNITALGSAPGASPATEAYRYDPLYRLTGVTDGNSALESYTYNKTGDRLSKTGSGLGTGVYGYTSGTHQLASIGNAARSDDANGNTTGSVMGSETFGFGYNGRNRPTVAQRNGQTVGTYTYNAFGQRMAKVATFPHAVTARYVYNEASQLIGEYGTVNRDYVWLGDIPVAVVDGEGAVTPPESGVTTLQKGTLLSISGASGSSQQFKIEVPSGALALSMRTSGGSGDVSVYVKFGEPASAANHDYVSTHTASNVEPVMVGHPQTGTYYMAVVAGSSAYAGVTVLATYTVPSNAGAVMQAGPRSDLGATGAPGEVAIHYITADQLGTPRAVSDESGNLVWSWAYQGNPFGEQQPTSSTGYVLNLRYPGQYYDAETNTNYNMFRTYESATGRYVQSDPTGLAGGISTYAYVGNSPLGYIDPLGLNVTMTCRPLSGVKKYLGWTSPKHCGDFVWHWATDPCTGKKYKVIDSQFSLAGFTTSPATNPNDPTYVDDRAAFYNPGGGNSNYNIPTPAGMTPAQFDQDVTSWGNQYSQGPYSLFPGPNSNTAAYDIIYGAGGTPPDVPDAPGNLYYVTPRFPPGYGQ